MSNDANLNSVDCPPYWEVWFVAANAKNTEGIKTDTFGWENNALTNPKCSLANTKGTWKWKGTTIFYEWPWVFNGAGTNWTDALKTLPLTFGTNASNVGGVIYKPPFSNPQSKPCPLSQALPSSCTDPTSLPMTQQPFPKNRPVNKEKTITLEWNCCADQIPI